MEYSIQFDESGKGAVVTVSGTSSAEGQIGLFNDLVNDPRFSRGMSILIDYSGLDERRASTPDVERIAQFVAGLDEQLGDSRLAIVVPDAVSYGLGRMSQARIRGRLQMTFFYDREAAQRWLSANE